MQACLPGLRHAARQRLPSSSCTRQLLGVQPPCRLRAPRSCRPAHHLPPHPTHHPAARTCCGHTVGCRRAAARRGGAGAGQRRGTARAACAAAGRAGEGDSTAEAAGAQHEHPPAVMMARVLKPETKHSTVCAFMRAVHSTAVQYSRYLTGADSRGGGEGRSRSRSVSAICGQEADMGVLTGRRVWEPFLTWESGDTQITASACARRVGPAEGHTEVGRVGIFITACTEYCIPPPPSPPRIAH